MIGALQAWWRRRAARQLVIGEAEWAAAESRLPFLGYLDADERAALRGMAREFIASKEWSAAAGLRLTPAIQIGVALQACLPILKLGLDWYAGWVGIVIYPGDFVIPRQMIDADGVVHEYDDEVMGEAWHGGPVLLSWFDEVEDADGVNVVIHEFAHKLDMAGGEADGVPPLPDLAARRAWIGTMETAFLDFQQRVDAGEDTALDPYGAEDPAEFFAVASEAFFETPAVLQADYPAVYALLAGFYRQNPLR